MQSSLHYNYTTKKRTKRTTLLFLQKSFHKFPAAVRAVSPSQPLRDAFPAHTVHIAQEKDQPHLRILNRIYFRANRVILALQFVHALPFGKDTLFSLDFFAQPVQGLEFLLCHVSHSQPHLFALLFQRLNHFHLCFIINSFVHFKAVRRTA